MAAKLQLPFGAEQMAELQDRFDYKRTVGMLNFAERNYFLRYDTLIAFSRRVSLLSDFVYAPLPAPCLPSVPPTDPDWQFSTRPHHPSPSITLSIVERARGNALGNSVFVESFRLHLPPHTIAVFISRYLETTSIRSQSPDSG